MTESRNRKNKLSVSEDETNSIGSFRSSAATSSATSTTNSASSIINHRFGSFLVAAVVFWIFALAVHISSQPPSHNIQRRNFNYEIIPEISINTNTTNNNITLLSTRRKLRSMNFIDRRNPDDLKKLHHKSGTYIDPHTTTSRQQNPLTADNYKINPLVKPDGYPWHRWVNTMQQQQQQQQQRPDTFYPLNTHKFVSILARLGNGENQLGDVSPQNYTQNGVPLGENTVRMHGMVRPYIIRGGTVLRPEGRTGKCFFCLTLSQYIVLSDVRIYYLFCTDINRTGMFVTLIQRAVELAGTLTEQDTRMKALYEGELPLIFDANDYPFCGDDLVPIFRLNAIRSRSCMHSWPVLSLTYFNDPTNFQLAESPYQWDELMTEWDKTYPWDKKIDKIVWRGRITGYTYKEGERPRQKLVQYARDFLDIMDIKPSTAKSKMAQDDFQRYKAILDIDGNAWSARLGKLL
jgi:hypothetical protein